MARGAHRWRPEAIQGRQLYPFSGTTCEMKDEDEDDLCALFYSELPMKYFRM
jgi:hypothetical protein